MARALIGYGEYHGRVGRHTLRLPRTHPENMALAAGVLLEADNRDQEELETDDEVAPNRLLGAKALEGAMA